MVNRSWLYRCQHLTAPDSGSDTALPIGERGNSREGDECDGPGKSTVNQRR